MPVASVNGINICYETYGNLGDDAIVLVRGRGTQLIDWPQEFTRGLTQAGLYVVTPDNRDAGLSSKVPQPYTMLDMAQDLVGLLDHLDIGSAHWLGISLGGTIVQRIAIHFAERVKCLFSVMSSSGAEGLPFPDAEIVQRLMNQPQDRDAALISEFEFRKLNQSPAYPASDAEIRTSVERSMARCYDPQAAARQSHAAMRDAGRTELLATIKAPTLVIHGDADPLVPPAHGEDTARRIPGAEFRLLEGVAHAVPPAAAPIYCEAVTNFIARRWPGVDSRG